MKTKRKEICTRNCTSSSQSATDVATRRKTLQHLPLHCQDVWGGVLKIPQGTRGVLNWKESTQPGWVKMKPAIQTMNSGDVVYNHTVHSVNTCIAVPCRVTKRVRTTKRIGRDNVYASRTLFSWKELEGTMILSCRQRRIQPITIEGTMTMSCRQRIQLKRKKWYYQIKDPSGKVMSNHLGQRWPGECFQPFQENFSAGSYSRIREQEFIGLTL